MPEVIASYEQPLNYDSTWSHIFQGANTIWLGFAPERLIMGNFFNGLQAQVNLQWDTQIPPGSTITAATVEYLPYNNNFNLTFTATINAPNRALATQPQDAMQNPFVPFLGWRQDLWSVAEVGALSTTFTAVFGTSTAGTNGTWIVRQLTAPGATVPNRAKMAQFITTRTGNMTIANVYWELSRTNNPAGNCRVRIQGVTNDRGVKIPDGVDIAVSNDLACSVVPTVKTLQFFTFAVNPTLVALTDYFLVFEADYAPDNTNYLNCWRRNQFIGQSGLMHYGEGLGMDWQNYPGVVDLNQAYHLNNFAGEDVIWTINRQDLGIPEVSPDITSLVQAQIDAANYTADSGIIVALSRFVPTAQSRWMASNTNPTWAGPILRLTYEEPVPGIKSRTHDKFNDLRDYNEQARREDDELLTISQGLIQICGNNPVRK